MSVQRDIYEWDGRYWRWMGGSVIKGVSLERSYAQWEIKRGRWITTADIEDYRRWYVNSQGRARLDLRKS